MSIQLSESEETTVLLEARLAKVRRSIEQMSADIQTLLNEGLGGHRAAHSHPLELNLRISLEDVPATALSELGSKFEKLVTEAQAAIAQQRELTNELNGMRPRPGMKVEVTFE